MDHSNTDLYAIFVPNSPDRHVFRELKEVKQFLDSPLGKKEGTRFKKCLDDNELNSFFEKSLREDTPTLITLTSTNSALSTSSGVGVEPVSPYRSLPTARFTEFRRAIEQKNELKFEEFLIESPRFLINTNNDLPAILQEGYRFNTLHVACRTGNTYVIKRSLELAADVNWLTHVYGTDSCVENRSKYIIEALLNTPDLIENNSPLHYACKFGHVDIARILLSYSCCKRYPINKYNEKPLDMLCRSFKGSEENKLLTQEDILAIFRPSSSPRNVNRNRQKEVLQDINNGSPVSSRNACSLRKEKMQTVLFKNDESALCLALENMSLASAESPVKNTELPTLILTNTNVEIVPVNQMTFFSALIQRLRAFKFSSLFSFN